jgi:hypothetical protein
MTPKTCAPGKWIPCAIENPGSLHRMLHVPLKEKIPDDLFYRADKAKVGGSITYQGFRIPITPLLKHRLNLAKRLRSFGRKKK